MDRFLDISSRLPNLADAEAKYALINGLKSEVQIHLLGQTHVTTLREALAELRVYAQARRGARPTTGSRADFGTAIGPTPMELGAHRSSRQRLTNTQSFRAPRPFSRGPPPRHHFNSNGPSRPSMQPHEFYQDRFRINSGIRGFSAQKRSRGPSPTPYCNIHKMEGHWTRDCLLQHNGPHHNPPRDPPTTIPGRGNP